MPSNLDKTGQNDKIITKVETMDGKRIDLKVSLKETHASALDQLASKDRKTAEEFIDEALDTYLRNKGVNPDARPAVQSRPKTAERPAPAAQAAVRGQEELAAPGTFERKFEELKARSTASSSILLRIPTVSRLWDFSEKANIMVGKRTVSEVYDFKKFLSMGEDQVQEYGLLKAKLNDLRTSRLLIRSLEHKKEHSTVSISSDELRKGYETFKDDHYAFISCLDGTFALIKTAVLKTLQHKENVKKAAEVLVPCGETVVSLPGEDDADNFRLTFDALTNKLDRIADKIITEYTPIDRKWSRLMEQQFSGLRILHLVVQAAAGVIIFGVITYFYVTDPRSLFPAFYSTEVIAGYRDFIAAYLMMLPVAGCVVNFLLIYVVWYQSTLAFIRGQVRRSIDRDMARLKRSIEMEL